MAKETLEEILVKERYYRRKFRLLKIVKSHKNNEDLVLTSRIVLTSEVLDNSFLSP